MQAAEGIGILKVRIVLLYPSSSRENAAFFPGNSRAPEFLYRIRCAGLREYVPSLWLELLALPVNRSRPRMCPFSAGCPVLA
jgi:hypothetical protein